MAITSSAKKEIRVSSRKRVFNLRLLRNMRNLIKTTKTKNRGGDIEGARAEYRLAQKAIDKAAKRGVIKQKTASRRKSSLSRAIKIAK